MDSPSSCALLEDLENGSGQNWKAARTEVCGVQYVTSGHCSGSAVLQSWDFSTTAPGEFSPKGPTRPLGEPHNGGFPVDFQLNHRNGVLVPSNQKKKKTPMASVFPP